MTIKIKKLRFKTRIIIGFSIILLISSISIIISLITLDSISKQAELIYEHPFTVNNSSRDINSVLHNLHICVKDIALENNCENLNKYRGRINTYRTIFEICHHILYSKYLGNENSVLELKYAFYNCYDLAKKALELKKQNNVNDLNNIANISFPKHKDDAIQKNNVIIDFAKNKANIFLSEIEIRKDSTMYIIRTTIISMFILSILLMIYISNTISHPIVKFISKTKKLIQKESDAGFFVNDLHEGKILQLIYNELNRIYKNNKSILMATMDNSPAGISLFDAPSGDITYINKMGKQITDSSHLNLAEDMNHYHTIFNNNIYYHDNTPYKFKDLPHIKTVVTGKNASDELIMKLHNGKKKHLWVNAAPIFNEQKEIISGIGIFLDITEQRETLKKLQIQNKKYEVLTTKYKKQNEELAKAKLKAEEINKLKSSFMATMSHELRTPLNTIIGLSELIDSDMSISEIIEMTNLINKNGNQLLDIVESILQLTLLQAGEYNIKKEIFNVVDLCSELKQFFKSEIIARNKQHLNTIFCANNSCENIQINTDRNKLNSLLKHIFINSIKFTEKGEVEGYYRVENKDILFKIRDTGTGIDKNLIDVIFEEFRQADNSNTRKFGGIGMGLATCKEIANLLGGEILIDSEVGKGTTFVFKLKNVVV